MAYLNLRAVLQKVLAQLRFLKRQKEVGLAGFYHRFEGVVF